MMHNADTRHKWLEYLPLLLALVALLCALLIINSKKLYWFDEAYTAKVLSSGSFSTVWNVITDDYDVVPPFYYFVGFAWTRIAGTSDLSLRLFTSLGIMVSLAVVWFMLRRTYGMWPSSAGAFGVLLLSYQVLRQNAEARFYGLYMALVALALFSYDEFARQERPSAWLYFATAVLHGALVTTHTGGFFYSGVILLSLLITDWRAGRFRLKAYLPIVMGWMVFVPWLSVFLRQIRGVRDYTWILPPTLTDLFVTYLVGLSIAIVPVLVLLLLLLWTILQRVKNEDRANQHVPAKVQLPGYHLLVVALFFAAMPLIFWIVSNTLVSFYVERYMLPSLLGYSILLTMICYRLKWFTSVEGTSVGPKALSTTVDIAIIVLVAVSIISPLASALVRGTDPLPDELIGPYDHSDLPIVVEDPLSYLSQIRYASHPERYVYVADHEAVYDGRSKINDRAVEALLLGLQRHYPDLNIVSTSDFLATQDRFLVLDWNESSWAELRVKENENYHSTVLNPGTTEPLVLLVVRHNTVENEK